ncbi:hypothetical protein XENTR_v10023434 [Xenopus tropicalis]|nr:hypothetical protein XENTR_v10023434 [Xenopus tropicalis]
MPMIQELLETARNLTEMFPIVVLTHKTSGNMREMKDTFENMGAERIFALENFTPEDHINSRGRHEDVLKFFCEMIKDIEFRLGRMGDPDKKRRERKKKVLKFIHDRDMKMKDQELQWQQMQLKFNHEREMKKKEEELERQRMREKKLQEEKEKLQRKKNNEGGCTVS